MRYTRLGRSGLEVSRVALGAWAFGGEWGAFDEGEARSVIYRALQLGLNFFDTAQAYGFGVSETVLASGLWPQVKREEVVIATKGGLRKEGENLLRDAGRSWLRAGVEASLRSLRTDYIDLYQVHWPDPATSAAETGAVLQELVREGKILHVGVSNYDVAQIEELSAYCQVEALQPPYHMFRREIEAEILPHARQQDIGVLVYGPLAHGLLSGRMTPDRVFPRDDWRHDHPDFQGETLQRNLKVIDRLKDLAREWGGSLPQLAVAWTLSHPAVHVALVGARRTAQLEETAAAAERDISDAERARVDEILADAVPVVGPSPEA